jgi:hypothetical protein
MPDIEPPKLRLAVDNTGPIKELRETAAPIALLVAAFSGPDEELIAVEVGELRRLLKAIEQLDQRGAG